MTASNSGTLTCAVQALTLTASPSGSYSYAFGGTSPINQIGASAQATVNAPGVYSVLITNANGCTASATTEVFSQTTTPTVSLASSNSLNCSLTSATLTATATGFGALTYAFRGTTGLLAGSPSSSSTAAINQPDTYTVLVTGENGCTATTTTTVSSDTALPSSLSLTSGTLTCAQTSLTLTATATNGTSFTFSGGIKLGSNQVVVNQAGSYSVTVSNANGCTATTTTQIASETTAPTVTVGSGTSLNCVVSSATLSANASGFGPLTYAFSGPNGFTSGPASAGTATINAPGTYTVLVTAANGCTASNTTTVLSETTTPDQVSLTASNSGTLTCAVQTLTLTASPSGSYTYAFGGTSPVSQISTGNTATINAPGTYTVLITNVNGCTASTTTQVYSQTTAPTVSLASSNSLNCAQPSATLRATATGFGTLTYAFAGLNGLLTGSPSSTSTVTINSPGTYTVVVIAANGCTATAMTTVVSDTAVPTNLSLTGGTLTCAQTSLTLTASATNGDSFTFSGGTRLGNNQVVVNQPGTYTLAVSNASGCTAMTTATIPGNTTAPLVSISPSAGLLTCTTTSLTLTANTDAVWRRWSDGSTGATLVVSASGTYGLSVTGTNGCTASATPVTINQDLSALAPLALGSSSPAFGCGGGTITLTATPVGADSYHFSGPSLNQISSHPTALATQTGTYSVTATKGICTATASISLGGTVGNPPNALLLGSGSLSCQTPTLSLTAVGGVYYSISGPGVVSQSDGSEPIIIGSYIINRRPIPTVGMAIVNKPGTYMVVVTGENGCTSTATLVVTGTECAQPR